jgi:hypothetical protein
MGMDTGVGTRDYGTRGRMESVYGEEGERKKEMNGTKLD